MPKKPRTNKRPPPKALPPKSTQAAASTASNNTAPPAVPPNRPAPSPHSGRPGAVANPYLNNGQPVDFSSFVPPPSTIDPKDPNFPNALSDWSASTLGKLNALPKLTQGQLSAIAEAAVGVANGPSTGTGGLANLGTATTSANGLPIDLPASLAALFEAKLTLDREKAKLLRMQKELKAHREQMHGVGNGKGKEIALEDDEQHECPCGGVHGHHDYPASAHSGEHSDEYGYETDEDMYACSAGCGCDCHAHFHEEDCDCGECQLSDDQAHDHHHHHHHHHGHGHHGHHHHHDHEQAEITNEAYQTFEEQVDIALDLAHVAHAMPDRQAPPPPPPPPPQQQQNDIAEQVRNATVQLKNATAEANRAALMAEAQQNQRTGQHPPRDLLTYAPLIRDGGGMPQDSGPRKHLSEDPDRLDELVRELFNWIKAVVWTIEQAAVVAGRRNWHNPSQVD